jgi:hypothetical protein
MPLTRCMARSDHARRAPGWSCGWLAADCGASPKACFRVHDRNNCRPFPIPERYLAFLAFEARTLQCDP